MTWPNHWDEILILTGDWCVSSVDFVVCVINDFLSISFQNWPQVESDTLIDGACAKIIIHHTFVQQIMCDVVSRVCNSDVSQSKFCSIGIMYFSLTDRPIGGVVAPISVFLGYFLEVLFFWEPDFWGQIPLAALATFVIQLICTETPRNDIWQSIAMTLIALR